MTPFSNREQPDDLSAALEPALKLALDLESKIADALDAFEWTDGEKQYAVFCAWVDAYNAVDRLGEVDRNRAMIFLEIRGRVPPGCGHLFLATIESFHTMKDVGPVHCNWHR